MPTKIKKPLLLYIHLNKCGGTTLQYIFHKNFFSYISLYPVDNEQNIIGQTCFNRLVNLFPFQGIGGHNLYPYINYQFDQPIIYIVFFREPINRYMSQLNFRITRGVTKDIDHFLEKERFINQQSKRIARGGATEEAKRFLSQENVFVGILEEFDLSLAMLRDFLKKWDVTIDIDYVVSNVTNRRHKKRYKFEELSADYQQKILQNNDKDQVIYRIALEAFELQKKTYPDAFNNMPKMLKKENWFHKNKRKAKQLLVKKIIHPRIKNCD